MNKRIRIIFTVALLLLLTVFPMEVLVNAEQAQWVGTDLYAITTVGGISPVEVKSTKLTFNVPVLPESGEEGSGVELSQPATLLASYQLYNPTEKQVSVKTALPIGRASTKRNPS